MRDIVWMNYISKLTGRSISKAVVGHFTIEVAQDPHWKSPYATAEDLRTKFEVSIDHQDGRSIRVGRYETLEEGKRQGKIAIVRIMKERLVILQNEMKQIQFFIGE